MDAGACNNAVPYAANRRILHTGSALDKAQLAVRGVAQPFNKRLKVHPRTVRLYAHSVKNLNTVRALICALSDKRRARHPSVVGAPIEPKAEETLGRNLTALQDHYRVRNKLKDPELAPRPASDKALSEATGISRKTIQAAREASRALGIDNVQKIARAYGLHAYQLLVPGLEPDNPATVPVTEEEKEMMRGVKDSMAKLRARGISIGQGTRPGAAGVGGNPPRPGRRKALTPSAKK